MAGSVRQFAYVDNSVDGATAWTGALSSAVLSGSLIVVAFEEYNGTGASPTSIVDNLNVGNYTEDVKSAVVGDSGDWVGLYSKPNSAAGSLTVSFTGSAANYQSATIMEITGAATASPVDVTGTDTKSITVTPASISLTTTQDNDIIIAGLGAYNATSAIVAGSGLTVVQSNTNSALLHRFATLKLEDAGAHGSKTITYSYSGGNTSDAALAAVAYKTAVTNPTPGVGAGTLTGIAGRMDLGLGPRTTIKGQT